MPIENFKNPFYEDEIGVDTVNHVPYSKIPRARPYLKRDPESFKTVDDGNSLDLDLDNDLLMKKQVLEEEAKIDYIEAKALIDDVENMKCKDFK